jgi:hypothetical protein
MSTADRQTWEDWTAGLDDATRARAEALRATFARLGAGAPEAWAQSQISENIPQLGRFVFLRAVWREIDQWRDVHTVPGLAGAATDEAIALAARVATRAAFEVALNIIQIIDDGRDTKTPGPTPGWQLIERDGDGTATGRVLGRLYDSFLATDPRQIQAEDILGD